LSLTLADAVADDGDEPQEGDPGERHEVKTDERHRRSWTRQVIHHGLRVETAAHGLPQEGERKHEQSGEDDPRYPGGARRREATLGCTLKRRQCVGR